MALLFYTGFDYFDQTQTGRVWGFGTGGTSLVPGRFGGRGWVFNNESAFLATLIENSSTVVVGLAMSLQYGDATNPIIVFQDATTSHTSPITQVDLRIAGDGSFQFTRNGTVLITSAPFVFTFSNMTQTFWNYIEAKVFINNSTGYVILRVNGATAINTSSLDTQNTGNNYVSMIRLQPFSSSGAYEFEIDDVYIVNDGGAPPQNDFLGECRVQTQYPTSNGELNNFAVTGASNNWQAVDDVISDDDATYVRSGIVGNIDDYEMGTVALTGTIYGVQINLTNRKDDVGTRSVAPIIHSVSTYYVGTTTPCQSNYSVAQTIWTLEPHSNAPWSNTSLNAITAGIKITA